MIRPRCLLGALAVALLSPAAAAQTQGAANPAAPAAPAVPAGAAPAVPAGAAPGAPAAAPGAPAAASALPAPSATGGDPARGEAKTSMCAGCHGIEGWRTAYPEVYSVPRIAGQHEPYLAQSLRAYRSGERQHPSMRAIVKDMSDKDIADLAAYYARGRTRTAGK